MYQTDVSYGNSTVKSIICNIKVKTKIINNNIIEINN